MKSSRSIIGMAALLPLLLCALAATNARATDRAYTCEPVKTEAKFSDAHCRTSTTAAEGFKHKLIESATEVTFTNAKTASSTTASSPAVLKGHIAGVETAVTCATVHGVGTLTNGATSVSGVGKLEYTGCTVTLPAGKGCKVTGGAITTNEMKATTEGTVGTTIKLEPASGSAISTTPIEGCEKERPPKGAYVVEGSLRAQMSGATAVGSHVAGTEEGTLLFGGTVAGMEGSLTVSMREPSGEPGSAIALTP